MKDVTDAWQSAYETLYSLLGGSAARLNPSSLLDRAVAGISDDPSIRSISSLMIIKLAPNHSDLTSSKLDDMSDRFRPILGFAPKETATRHEHEKANEAKRNVIILSVELSRILADAGGANQTRVRWSGYLEDTKKDYGHLWRDAERELDQRIQ